MDPADADEDEEFLLALAEEEESLDLSVGVEKEVEVEVKEEKEEDVVPALDGVDQEEEEEEEHEQQGAFTTAAAALRKPQTTDRGLAQFEKKTGLEITDWKVRGVELSAINIDTSLATLEREMASRHRSQGVSSRAAIGNLVAVIGSKTVATNSSGQKYGTWLLADLQHTTCLLFVHGEAFRRHYLMPEGTVIIVSPNVLPAKGSDKPAPVGKTKVKAKAKGKKSSLALTVSNPAYIFHVGHACNFGYCPAHVGAKYGVAADSGRKCGQIVNTKVSRHCSRHMQADLSRVMSRNAALSHQFVSSTLHGVPIFQPAGAKSKTRNLSNNGRYNVPHSHSQQSRGGDQDQGFKMLSKTKTKTKSPSNVVSVDSNGVVRVPQVGVDSARCPPSVTQSRGKMGKRMLSMVQGNAQGKVATVSTVKEQGFVIPGSSFGVRLPKSSTATLDGAKAELEAVEEREREMLSGMVNSDAAAAAHRILGDGYVGSGSGSGMSAEERERQRKLKEKAAMDRAVAIYTGAVAPAATTTTTSTTRSIAIERAAGKRKTLAPHSSTASTGRAQAIRNAVKRARLGKMADAMGSVDMDKVMSAKSVNEHLVAADSINKLQMLEQEEAMASHLQEIREERVFAFKCINCNMISEYPKRNCKEKGHKVVRMATESIKRFFECVECRQRVETLNQIIPTSNCLRCVSKHFKRVGKYKGKRLDTVKPAEINVYSHEYKI